MKTGDRIELIKNSGVYDITKIGWKGTIEYFVNNWVHVMWDKYEDDSLSVMIKDVKILHKSFNCLVES